VAADENAGGIGSYEAIFRRRGVWIVTIVPAALLLSLFMAYALPAEYRSTATLTLEQGAISEDLVKSTVRSYADQQIDIIQGRVMTVDAIRDLVKEYDPYPEESQLSASAKALRVIKDTSLERVDPVTYEPREQSSAVSLHYDNPNPQRASEMASRLADLFLTYHQRARVGAARAAEKLIADRAAALAKELEGVDDEYARLRVANGGTLPDTKGNAEDVRVRADRDFNDLERQLRVAQERESLLSIQLSGISPNLLSTKGDLTDMATVKAQLADAELRYTPDHPDVKRLKRALAALMAQQGSQAKSGAAVNADNPEYRRVAGELASARAEVAALQGSVARERVQLDRYTANVNPSAALERQVAELDRRRTSLQNQYQALQEKLKSAQLGQLAESSEHAEHFSLLQAPYAASHPFWPNRIGVILLGVVLGLALAAAAVSIVESIDPTVRGSRDLLGLNGLPILGMVPEILLPNEQARRRRAWGTVIALYAAFVVIDAVAIFRAQVHQSSAESSIADTTTGQPS